MSSGDPPGGERREEQICGLPSIDAAVPFASPAELHWHQAKLMVGAASLLLFQPILAHTAFLFMSVRELGQVGTYRPHRCQVSVLTHLQ